MEDLFEEMSGGRKTGGQEGRSNYEQWARDYYQAPGTDSTLTQLKEEFISRCLKKCLLYPTAPGFRDLAVRRKLRLQVFERAGCDECTAIKCDNQWVGIFAYKHRSQIFDRQGYAWTSIIEEKYYVVSVLNHLYVPLPLEPAIEYYTEQTDTAINT